MKRGIKRIDYLDEEEEESKEPEEAEEEISETEPNGSEDESKPPDCKRYRKVEIGDGWEKISPIKWRSSPIGKTFASINIGGKGRKTSCCSRETSQGIHQHREVWDQGRRMP